MFRTHEPNVPDTSATPSGGALPPPGATAAPAPSAHDPRSRSSRCSHAIALVIDAMDLMHKGTLDGFCLVSSDSDFTRLAQRLREEGMVVYGFGEQKAVKAFRNACNRFIYVENLVEASTEESDAGGPSAVSATKKQPPSRAVKIIAKAIEDSDDDGWANLSGVGSRILGAKPDFDARSYGCPNLSTLVERSGGFEVRKDQGAVYIRRKAAKRKAAPADRARMTAGEFLATNSTDRLAQTLHTLAETTDGMRQAAFRRAARSVQWRVSEHHCC